MAIITTSIKCMVSDSRFDPMLVNDLMISREERSGRLPIFVASIHVPAGSPRRAAMPSKFVRLLLECVSTPELDALAVARIQSVYVRLIHEKETP